MQPQRGLQNNLVLVAGGKILVRKNHRVEDHLLAWHVHIGAKNRQRRVQTAVRVEERLVVQLREGDIRVRSDRSAFHTRPGA